MEEVVALNSQLLKQTKQTLLQWYFLFLKHSSYIFALSLMIELFSKY